MATTPDETTSVPASHTSNHATSSARTNGATIISIPTASGLSSNDLILFCKFIYLADAIASFNWGSYLKQTGAHGGPVSFFRHVSNCLIGKKPTRIMFFVFLRRHYKICGHS